MYNLSCGDSHFGNAKSETLRCYSPLSKFLIVLAFLICTASFPRYDLAGTSVFFLFSVVLIFAARADFAGIACRSLPVLPFVFCTGIANCILDTQQVALCPGLTLQGGFLSLLVLICKALASVNIVLLFSACTSFQEISGAMSALHIPCVFVLQIQLMFRYLGVVAEEAVMMHTAWRLRNPVARCIPIREWGPLAGHLLIRSLNRAGEIYQAMQCRLFHAGIPLSTIRNTSPVEHAVCIFFIAVFILVRIFL